MKMVYPVTPKGTGRSCLSRAVRGRVCSTTLADCYRLRSGQKLKSHEKVELSCAIFSRYSAAFQRVARAGSVSLTLTTVGYHFYQSLDYEFKEM